MADASSSLQSFLRRDLKPSWVNEPGCILTAPMFDFDASTLTGAAYRRDGSLILSSLRSSWLGHWRHVDPVSIRPDDYPWSVPGYDTAIYGGHFFSMWGHFLYETLSTAAMAPDLPQCPVVFTAFAQGKDGRAFMRSWEQFKPLLAAAGWGDRPLALQTAAMRFNHLIVPERLSVYAPPLGNPAMAGEMAGVYAAIRTSIADAEQPTRPMVACRPSGNRRQHPAEEEAYGMLASRGFLVVNGIEHSPAEQAKVFAGASALVGFAGSNLHNSLFCHPGIMVLEVGDRRSYDGGANRINPTQVSMCELLEQRIEFVESFTGSGSGSDLTPVPAAVLVDDVCKRVAAHQWVVRSAALADIPAPLPRPRSLLRILRTASLGRQRQP